MMLFELKSYYFIHKNYIVAVSVLENGKWLFKATEKELVWKLPTLNKWCNEPSYFYITDLEGFSKRSRMGAAIALSLGFKPNKIAYFDYEEVC